MVNVIRLLNSDFLSYPASRTPANLSLERSVIFLVEDYGLQIGELLVLLYLIRVVSLMTATVHFLWRFLGPRGNYGEVVGNGAYGYVDF